MAMRSTTVLAVLVLLGGLHAAARAEEFPRPKVEYEADQHMHMESGGQSFDMVSKIYSAKDRERREHSFGGGKSVMILRRDKRVTWTLIPQAKRYQEHAMGEAGTKGNRAPDWGESGDVQLDKVGPARLNGQKTTKYVATVSNPDGSKSRGAVWLTKDDIPVKVEGTFYRHGVKSTFRIELENLKIGKQDPALFEIPAGYAKLEIPKIPGADAASKAPMTGADLERLKQQLQQQTEDLRKMYPPQ